MSMFFVRRPVATFRPVARPVTTFRPATGVSAFGGFNTFGSQGNAGAIGNFLPQGGLGGFPYRGQFFTAFGPTTNATPFLFSTGGQPTLSGPAIYPNPLLGQANFFPAQFPGSENYWMSLIGATTPNISGGGFNPFTTRF